MGGVGLGGGQVDVNEIEVFVKIKKNNWGGRGGRGVSGRGRVGGGGGQVDVNEIEVFVKIQKKKKLGGSVGGSVGGSEWM